MQQGSSEGPSGFCIGLHKDLVTADRELAEHGGCAKADMDDIYMLGTIETVLPAALAFVASDVVLAFETFVLPEGHRFRRIAPYAVWPLYWGAQLGFWYAFS